MQYYDLLVRNENARKRLEDFGFSKSPQFLELDFKDISKAYDPKRIVFVRGGTLEQNQKIVRSPVDVLLDSCSKKFTIDSAVVQVAMDNDVCFGISLSQFLNAKKFGLIRMITNYSRLMKLCNKMGARILLVSGAWNEFGIRTPIQLASLGMLLGQTKQQAKWSISKIPEYLIKKKNLG